MGSGTERTVILAKIELLMFARQKCVEFVLYTVSQPRVIILLAQGVREAGCEAKFQFRVLLSAEYYCVNNLTLQTCAAFILV